MNNFFKTTLATITGIVIFNIIAFIIFLIVMGVIIVSVSGDSLEPIKPNTVLTLKLNYPIKDHTPENPFEKFRVLKNQFHPALGLNDILKNIDRAKKDPKIKGIYLETSVLQTGIATIEEIRNALIDFKKSGKFVISYADSYLQTSYYLSSVADSVFINPTGYIYFTGLKSEKLFYKKALDKLGVEPQIFRHGKFKSYVEPFQNTKMSIESKSQREKFLFSVWNDMLEKIGSQRNIKADKLNELANNLSVRSAKEAVKNGLIDDLRYKDEVSDLLLEMSGYDDEEPQLVGLVHYQDMNLKKKKKKDKRDKIAVIYAEGSIGYTEGEEKISAESLCKTIREVRLDSTVKAIVFRVNSGGGSALASDVIWRELYLAGKEKPIIASMGSAAASGGYYILAYADTIVANPNTITGSIGVFGMLFNAEKFFDNKLGITSDIAKTNDHAGFGSPLRPLDPVEKATIQFGVDEFYKDFVAKVAEGRNMDTSSVDKIAGGRIWSGIDAKELGLVDVIGGLNTAIKIAADKIGTEDYNLVELPKSEGAVAILFSGVKARIKQNILEKELGENYKYFKNLEEIVNLQGIQARMPFEVKVY